MAVDIWRDIANNKVYVKYGLETIEVPHAIAEAYRQDEAKDFRLLYSVIDSLKLLCIELYEDQCDDCDKWKYRDRMRKLGIEVTE